MMNKFKNYQLISCLALALFLPAIFLVPVQAAEKTAPVITATGYSTQEFSPDTGCVTLSVQTEATTTTEAQAQNAKIANQVRDSILASGVKEKDIKTTSYHVSPIYQNQEPGSRKKPAVIGYMAVNSVIVYVPAYQTGQIIDLALKSGATQITDVRFSLKDNKKASQDAVALAVADAMGKLESIAKALGKKIVRVQSVNEINTNVRPVALENRMYAGAMDAKESYDATPISQGTVTISSSVQVTAEID